MSKWLFQRSSLVIIQLYHKSGRFDLLLSLDVTHWPVWLKTFVNVSKVMSYYNCALCLAFQMRQDQAQWRASMTLWTLTLCLRRPRGVYTADTPYWQLSDPHSWATSQPQPRLLLMFTFSNIEIGETKLDLLIEAGVLLGHEDETEKWNNNRKKCVDVKH